MGSLPPKIPKISALGKKKISGLSGNLGKIGETSVIYGPDELATTMEISVRDVFQATFS